MVSPQENFSKYLQQEVNRWGDILVPEKAGYLERKYVKKVACTRLHPNPDDEFCWPSVGPNDRIIGEYLKQYHQTGKMKREDERVESPLMVEKVSPSGYMILNGHHRWAAYLKAGIKKPG